jgi:hypothetical protein
VRGTVGAERADFLHGALASFDLAACDHDVCARARETHRHRMAQHRDCHR